MKIDRLIEFLKIVGKLKSLKRAGWVKSRIRSPETVAEHSFRTAVMAMILAPQLGIDQLKSMKMAIIHDIGEANIGDIITMIGRKIVFDPKLKLAVERKAIENIFSLIDGKEYIKLYKLQRT